MTAAEMEHIITQYGDDIYRFCFHITGCREEADDLYQDTFVKAIQLRHRLDSGGNVKSYLMGVAANLWKNQVKKQRRREEIVPEVSFEQTGWTIGEGTDPLDDYMGKERMRSLYQAVHHLPEKQRIVVILHYTQDYSASEIAKILHIPRGTVLSRLTKARENIKTELEGKGYEV